MKKLAKISFNLSCLISIIIAILHFFVPYITKWFSYIPDAPIEIVQSINYINFCFSFLLVGISIILLIVQNKLFNDSKEVMLFYVFFILVWLSRVVIQLIWPWPSGLQLWLVIAFSMQLIFTLIPLLYLMKRTNSSKP